jgi:uncharacterized protein (TIGR02271 family)
MTFQSADLERLTEGHLLDADGDKIGRIADIYVDNASKRPEWVLVNTGLLGTRESFVPIAEATERDGDIVVPYDKATVKGAPSIDADGELSDAEEAELYRYYGMRDPFAEAATPAPGTETGTDTTMTRSEEEMRAGTVKRPSELVRLKKYVVTEHQQMTVPVQHEEVRVVTEPITDANRAGGSDTGITEDAQEVVLNQEEVVIEKKVVPKERVRLDKETVTEQREVEADVRKEKIDVERDPQAH